MSIYALKNVFSPIPGFQDKKYLKDKIGNMDRINHILLQKAMWCYA